MTKVLCDFCRQPFCYTDISKLSVPMTPGMFSSLMPENGVPDPFHSSLTWQDFKCPYCRLRPFEKEDEITIEISDGTRLVKISNTFRCDQCDKEYQHQTSLARHKREQHGN